MSIRIGINGFGRMGRLGLRAAWGSPDLEFLHINEIACDAAASAHLLQFDSVHGAWELGCEGLKDAIQVEGRIIGYSSNKEIGETNWSGCDIVIEATGKHHKKPESLQHYFDQGVRKVIVAAPTEGALNIVYGINDHLYDPQQHHLVTAASCTTNCLAPVVKVMHERVGILHGCMTTIHDITNTQIIVDKGHKDLRRARACGQSLIPTTTGSAKAITKIFPELTGKLNGHAVRVPILNASLTDFVFEARRPVTLEEVNGYFQEAAQGELKGILGYEERPLVSVDYVNDPRSSIVDALSTMVIDGTQVKIYAWYDNEWGYVNRMMDIIAKIAAGLEGTMDTGLRNYLVVTGGYWAFTVTDGAIRMLVVLYFHQLGYSPFEVAMLFLFYEIFGIVTNLVGGWLGARIGLNLTMHIGMSLQVIALTMLTVSDAWLSVAYVMFAQALSGIAKDLNKMSAKASVKTLTGGGGESRLFKYVAVLTGSKNALKGAGFFVGAALLQWIGFRGALWVLAGALLAVLIATAIMLPSGVGKMKSKPKFAQVFSNTPAINWLSAARFFLFGARDVWFVVGLPVFLSGVLGWSHMQVGGFLAVWVMGYGFVQAAAPKLVRRSHHGQGPGGGTARLWALTLAAFPAGIAAALAQGLPPGPVLVVGLILFGIVFAINSAVHSYLILAYSDFEKVSMNVGFYYMANAGGRLAGTVLSGLVYQTRGLEGCLWWSAGFVLAAFALSLKLPEVSSKTAKVASAGV